MNWAMVYFAHALAGFIIFGLWLLFFDDHPHKSSAVSKVELEKIQRDKTEALLNGDNDIPYKVDCMFMCVIYKMHHFRRFFRTL